MPDKLKKIIKAIKELGHFYILLVPEKSSKESKARRFSPLQMFSIVMLYTSLVGIMGFLIFRTSPVDGLVFDNNPGLSVTEKKMINELDMKMRLLVEELENLRSYNARLQTAVQLGDSTIFDSIHVKAAVKPAAKKNTGGNILGVIRNLFAGRFNDDREKFFFIKPVNGFISREFYPENGHTGLDYIVKTGTPVYSSANGYILFADYTEKDGYKVIINHPDNYVTVYKHCSYIIKKEKDRVVQGELIALSGNTGDITTGPHLHFEIWHNGKPVNPKNLLIDY